MIDRRWTRRRLQFSLRMLLVVMLVAAVVLGFWSNRVSRQRRFAQAILAVGGLVRYGDDDVWAIGGEDPFVDSDEDPPQRNRRGSIQAYFGREWWKSITEVDLNNCDRATNEFIRQVNLPPDLRALSLNATDVTDIGLGHLAPLRDLKSLEIASTKVTDRGLRHVANLPNLRYLDLGYTAVGNEGVAALQALPSLEVLILDHTNVSDRVVRYLLGHARLRLLMLRYTAVTDDGLQQLLNMSSLEDVHVDGCAGVTAEGIEDFRSRAPNCRIWRDR